MRVGMTTGKFDSDVVAKMEDELWESMNYFDEKGGVANTILWKSQKIG